MSYPQVLEIDRVIFLLSIGFYCLLGSTFFWTLTQYLRHRRRGLAAESRLLEAPLPPDHDLPAVLVQLPTYNEGALVGRICAAVAELDWPRDRLKVQILDDSTDGSEAESERAVASLQARGVEATLPRRTVRRGFKAGALAEGLRLANEPFVLVFDADYVPAPDFLKACMRPLIADDRLAFVQARCDFLNGEENALTRAQQRILDAHYAVEQPARSWSGQILPFNGTCGIWRRAAIEDAGGWQGDTLAEDMDLSFRVQLKGWRALFLASVAVPGELPNSFTTWRRQQFRWTKGTAEVTQKLLAQVWGSRLSLGRKLVATLYLGGGLFGMLFGLTLVSGVIALVFGGGLPVAGYGLIVLLLAEVLAGPMLLQLASQKCVRGRRLTDEIARLPGVMGFQVGVSLANLGAGLEALIRRRTDFVRTPKAGPVQEAS